MLSNFSKTVINAAAIATLIAVSACTSEVATEQPKVYDDVADCPPEWQACASADGHTGVDAEPSEGVAHWVATCGPRSLGCLVVLQ